MVCEPSRCGGICRGPTGDIEDAPFACARTRPVSGQSSKPMLEPSQTSASSLGPLPAPSPPPTPHFHIAIVGAGVIGLAIARRLSAFSSSVLVIERSGDVGTGATKSNSGIVHAGFDDRPGTMKSKVCFPGNQAFDQLEKELQMGFRRVGSYVLAYSQEDIKGLEELMDRARKNGVPDCEIQPRSEILKKEPNLNHEVIAGLWCPHAGLVSPYEYAIALAQNAVKNGVTLRLGEEVTSIDVLESLRQGDPDHGDDEEELQKTVNRVLESMETGLRTTPKESSGNLHNFLIQTNGGLEGDGYQYTATIVINAAGLFSDRVASMVGVADFTIAPRKGEYLILDRPEKAVVNTVLFPMPSKEKGKGILVSPTYWGQLLLGPTSRKIDEVMGREDVVRSILAGARRTIHPPILLPHLRKVLTSYTGLRAKSSRADFIIEETKVPNFINVAGIDSPGLTSSYAIAGRVVDIIKNCTSLVLGNDGKEQRVPSVNLSPNPNYDPYRPRLLHTKPADFDGVPDDPRGPKYNVICRCEVVTEEEVVASIRNDVGARDIDGAKRRCRAGMGICQGSYCQPRVTSILARELKIPESMVPGRGAGSSLLPHRKALWADRRELVDIYEDAEAKDKTEGKAKL